MSHTKDKVVVITGTGSGFGRLVACKAAARGARVVGADVNDVEVAKTADMITAAGGQGIGLRADVTNPADMNATVRPTGIPSTGIASGVVNFDAGSGITGVNPDKYFERFSGIMDGSAPREWSDPNHIEYFSLAPEELADQILYVMDQPWGVSISDITVRASGDLYVI
jgi:NADP-dependent 3-hydroxy acid dehydrogenase YdfG